MPVDFALIGHQESWKAAVGVVYAAGKKQAPLAADAAHIGRADEDRGVVMRLQILEEIPIRQIADGGRSRPRRVQDIAARTNDRNGIDLRDVGYAFGQKLVHLVGFEVCPGLGICSVVVLRHRGLDG